MEWKITKPYNLCRFYQYGQDLIFRDATGEYVNLKTGAVMPKTCIEKLEQILAGSVITITA